MNKSIEEKITNLEHQIQILLQGQEAIKSHLWKEPGTKTAKPITELQHQEQEAENYVNHIILPKAQGIGTQGFWQGAILNYLKQQALNYVGTVLKQLVIEKMVELAKWLLDNLQGTILTIYQKANEEEKEIFKNKLQEVFPDSPLLGKL